MDRNALIKKFSPYLLALLLAVGAWLMLSRSKTVQIVLNGEEISATVKGFTVKDALQEAGIPYNSKLDLISPSPNALLYSHDSLSIDQAQIILIKSPSGSIRLISPARDLTAIFDQAGLTVSEKSRIVLDGSTHDLDIPLSYAPRHQIVIYPQAVITVRKNATTKKIRTTQNTLGEALYHAGFNLHADDLAAPFSRAMEAATQTVNLKSAGEITIQASKTKITTSTAAETVGEALAESGITLQGLDYSIPAENKKIPDDKIIQIVRVEEESIIEQSLTPYEILSQPVPDLPIDNYKLVQAGENGIQAKRIKIRYEDDEEVSRDTEDSWIVKLPSAQIEGYGTKITVRTLDTPNGPIQYWRAHEFRITSYHPGEMNPNNPWYGHVYCGGLFKAGFIAVDLNYIPCGTQIYIPGYGIGIAMDTGHIRGAWIDLGYTDEEYIPWSKYLTVYFLAPIPPLDQIPWKIPPGTSY